MGVDTYVPVPEFYAGKSVFITGGSGYLGKVLLEKLLYSCPEVNQVFVLLRDKKNVDAEQRLQNVINLPMFCRLRKERPEDFKKVVLLKGDISAQNLNMQNEDLEAVIEKVSVVIHTAATIKFNDSLKTALRANFEGTRNVLNLCHLMKNLRVFVHVSTAYCNSDQAIIEERVYPPPVTIEEAYRIAEDESNNAKIVQFLNGRPNTYTFTKALAEHLVSETHGDIPVVIIRPSIVTPSIEEPVKGWVDNWFGATGLITAIAKGFCRVIYTTNDNIIDIIPVDYVCNLTLVAATRAEQQSGVVVYNSCSGSSNPITIKQITDLYCEAGVKDNFNELPYPEVVLRTRHHWLVRVITLLSYFVAYVADIFIRLCGSRPKYTKLISQTYMVRDALAFFTYHSWVMKTERSEALFKTMSPTDARQFPFLARDINWNEYFTVYFQGVKKYLVEKKQA